MTRFIAVTSVKGGVGKTTTSINLALALTQFGYDVLLLDANLSNPHVGLHLGSPLLKDTLNDALQGKKDCKDIAYLHPSGIKVIPSGISLEEHAQTSLRALSSVLDELRGTAQVVLLDSSPGVQESSLVMQAVPEVILISTPDLPAVTDTLKTVKLARKHHCKIRGLILTHALLDKTELSVENITALLEVPLLGVIPFDLSVKKALMTSQPLLSMYPESPSGIAYKQAAAKLVGEEYKPTKAVEQQNISTKELFGKLFKN
jgi:septum site-determining protein MinD